MKKVLAYGIMLLMVLPTISAMLMEVKAADGTSPVIVRINNPFPEAEARFGKSVDGLGDINGDGIGDIVVGAPGADKVYVLSGVDPNIIIRTISDPGGCSGFWFGYSVRGVGDIDGDGVEDIAVGAPSDWDRNYPPPPIPLPPPAPPPPPDPCKDRAEGRVFVFSGASGGLILTIKKQDTWCLGIDIAPLGDIDGDGTPDLAVSDPVLKKGDLPFAAVYAVSGADGSVLWTSPEPPPYKPPGRQELPSFGYYMAEVGDLTGDGKRELLVAAPVAATIPNGIFEGIGYVLNGTNGYIMRLHFNPTPVDWDWFGVGSGAVGDQDGDGIEDYAFGEAGAGVVRLYSGATGSQFLVLSRSGGSFGWQIAKVDDVDWDGLDDFWVSAPEEEKVYLINKFGNVLVQVDDPNPIVTTSRLGFGHSLSVTQDLDGDGAPDLIIGNPTEEVNSEIEAGAVFLVLGVKRAHTTLYMDPTDQYVDPFGRVYIRSSTTLIFDVLASGTGSAVAQTGYRIYNEDIDTGWMADVPPISLQLEGLDDGTYYIDYASTNNVGNVEDTNTEMVILDNTPPVVTETNYEGLALQDEVTLEISAWDLSEVSSVTLSIRCVQGDIVSSMSATLSPDGKWEADFDTTLHHDGFYFAEVTLTDVLGNTGATILPFSIRNWACIELLPASESNKAGRTMPVKFSLRVKETVDPAQPFVYNEDLTIIIYEDPENILQESTYGNTARDYRINSVTELYITNFKTLKNPTTYTVEIQRKGMQIGSFTFETVK